MLFVRTAVSRTEQSGVVHLRMRTLSIKSTIPTSEQQEKKHTASQYGFYLSASSGTLSVVDLWSFEVCRSREVVESLQSLDLMPREGGKRPFLYQLPDSFQPAYSVTLLHC